MTAKPKVCTLCGGEIPLERYEALRGTALCVRCSEETGGEFKVSLVQERISKPGSLKVLTGGVTPRVTRRQVRPKKKP